MEMTIGIIVGLIILSFGLCYKIAQLSHRLKLSDKENEDIRNKYAKSESNLKEEISDLQQKYSTLDKNHSKLKKIYSDSQKKHAKEISDLTTKYNQEMAKLAGQQAIDKMNSAIESDS